MKTRINESDNKVQYAIKDIEKLTGVKAHTLRIWEQRYGFLIPHRTDTKIRYYDDEQLKKLLNISILLKNGKKISKVAQMSSDEISKEIFVLFSDLSLDKDRFFEIQADSLIPAMIDLDEAKFEKVISLCTLKYGFESTMLYVLIPFLSKVGILWTVGDINVAQEHFITNLIRRKIIVAIDAFAPPQGDVEKFLLFLPEGELHEIGLLFAKYLIKSKGKRVVYLGQSLPYDDLKKLSEKYNPNYLLTYFTIGMSGNKMQDYINNLSIDFKSKKIIICGSLFSKKAIKLPSNVVNYSQIHQLIDLLKK